MLGETEESMTNEYQISGIHPVKEALRNNRIITKVMIQRGISGEEIGELIRTFKAKNIPLQHVPKVKLDRTAKINHQGIIAFTSPVEFYEIDDILEVSSQKKESPFILILDGITDTRNFGAICRTAECMGVHGIIIPKNNSASITSGTVKSSAGAIFSIKIARVNHLLDAVYHLQASEVPIISCTEKASDSIYDFTPEEKGCAIILGSEEKGIQNKLISVSDNHLKIPTYGQVQSLNVSVAAGMFLYEFKKNLA